MKNACIALLLIPCAGCEAPTATQPPERTATRFEQTFPKPAWFDSVDAPLLSTSEEVSTLWQSVKRCCGDDNAVARNNRIFYKSCYNAIADHYEDERLVVECLWLMDVGAGEDQRPQLARFLVENFPHHKNNIDHCANCMPGDTVARVTLDLARYESDESHDKTLPIGRLEKLLDSRQDEISYWVQAEIYEFLGRLYLETGVTQPRLERYRQAYERLDQAQVSDEPLRRRFPPVRKLYEEMSSAVRSEKRDVQW